MAGVPLDYLDESHSEYDISLRVVRFEISSGCFENIITNLPGDLKYPLCLKAFHSKKYEYIVQEIWARAILHNFSSAIISGVPIDSGVRKYEYQVNFAEAFKTCRDFLRIHDGRTEMDVESLIAQNLEPIRPGRTFACQHRFKLPISFCLRN